MAINKNHEFDDLDGIKCAIVEKNVLEDRVNFLKDLLTVNGFTVMVVPSPPPKTAVEATELPTENTPPSTFTIGVTNVVFNATNAIFGRLLKTRSGKVVTLAYWQQSEKICDDSIPYYQKKS
jgi:hypothetical protein